MTERAEQVDRWHAAVAEVRADPELHEDILRSVMSSMELAGFIVTRERSERIFEMALSGPALIYDGEMQDAVPAAREGEHHVS